MTNSLARYRRHFLTFLLLIAAAISTVTMAGVFLVDGGYAIPGFALIVVGVATLARSPWIIARLLRSTASGR